MAKRLREPGPRLIARMMRQLHGGRWEDVVEDAEPFIKKYMQLGDEARQMINAAISAAYKYERANDGLFPMGKQVRLMIDREEDTGETEV